LINIAARVAKTKKRREDIADLLLTVGHPKLIKQSQLAQKYGVSQQQICKDMKVVKEALRNKIGNDATMTTNLFYESMVPKLLENERIMEANQLIKDWNKWLFDVGAQIPLPPKNADGGCGCPDCMPIEKIRKIYEETIAKDNKRKE